MNGAKHVLQKHTGILILTVSLILVFFLLWWLRNIILPFIVGLVLAFLLLPVTTWIERKLPKRGKWMIAKRIFAIILVYILLLAIIGGVGFYAVSAAINNFSQIVENAPDYFATAFQTIQDWLENLRSWLPAVAGEQIGNLGQNLGDTLGNAFQNLFMGIVNVIPASFTYITGFATLPIFLFYLLKDHEHLSKRFLSWPPGDASRHLKNISQIITEVLGGYLRAQIVSGFFVGLLALIGLIIIIDLPVAVGLAVVAGISELVPVLGPWIGGAIAALVVLAIQPESFIWVIVIFFAVQLIENSLLVPRIQGQFMHVHPAVAVVLIIVGAAIAGFWGLILAVPLASTIVRIYQYVMQTTSNQDNELLLKS